MASSDNEGFEIIDGLGAQRLGSEDKFAAGRVRIRETAETVASGFAGLFGEILGETKPSRSRVPVIGATDEDYAISVWFEASGQQAWFSTDLVEPAASE